MVAGKPIAGSWWGHPAGAAIYREGNRLADRRDVLVLKLLNGKVTFVHRTLWPHLLTVGRSGEPWQVSRLSHASQHLLDLVQRTGLIRTDDPRSHQAAGVRVSAAALDLERRLLLMARQIHTETGRHAKALESWSHWARRVGLQRRLSLPNAKAELQERVDRLNTAFQANARLPWQR